ncbi:MAG: purine-binding chemotaxis protein CheW [Ekhidna sp.]|nr:purine-binding chemotaxis protein CheW [Ekhidna sp.]MBC6409510.1 purine-binding chemotaxis protein CheW [Ekhidna sp.]MBC6424889.1 purine-binding chemotaxis protein CheW [Ekhidna sp.]
MALGMNLSVKKKKDVREDQLLKAESEKTDFKEKAIDTDRADGEDDNIINKYCVFKAGSEEYAIPVNIIREVVKYSEPASIPQMPDYILGMANIRGNIYGLMDLACFFKGVVTNTERNYLLVLDHDEFKMAISVEEVPNLLMVSDNEVEELSVSSLKSAAGQKFIQGIIKLEKRMIMLLNVPDMISNQEFTGLKSWN